MDWQKEISVVKGVPIGVAGEYLVASRITRWGYEVSLAPQHCAYDLVVGHPSTDAMLRLQVKTCVFPAKHGGKGAGTVYKWKTYRGKGASSQPYQKSASRYSTAHCDAFALVALDIERFETIKIRQRHPVTMARSRGRLMKQNDLALFTKVWNQIAGD